MHAYLAFRVIGTYGIVAQVQGKFHITLGHLVLKPLRCAHCITLVVYPGLYFETMVYPGFDIDGVACLMHFLLGLVE